MISCSRYPFFFAATFGLAISFSAIPTAHAEQKPVPTSDLLIEAAWSGNINQVKTLLAGGADINARGAGGVTALIAAADLNRQGIVRLLLDRGADVNAQAQDGLTVLIAETQTGDAAIVERILALGANVNAQRDRAWSDNTPLQGAVEKGGPKIVRMLVEHGANVNTANADGRTPLMEAAFQGDAESVRLLLKHGAAVNAKDSEGNTALYQAAEGPPSDQPHSSSLGIVQSLIAAGADWRAPGPDGETILMRPSAFGHIDIVRYFLHLGADVNARTKDGRTALMAAGTSEPATALLLSAGANVNLHDNFNHRTALIEAADEGSLPIVRRLLAARTQVNARDNWGRTALMWAINKGHIAIVSLLIKHGANVHLRDETESPWQLAKDYARWQPAPNSNASVILRLLRKAGADKKPKR